MQRQLRTYTGTERLGAPLSEQYGVLAGTSGADAVQRHAFYADSLHGHVCRVAEERSENGAALNPECISYIVGQSLNTVLQ